MSFKKCQVVMLPTNEKAKEKDIILLKEGNTPSTKTNELAICEFPSANNLGVVWQTQHIYILSDEVIKEGDWYYWSVTNTIQKAVKDSLDRLPKTSDGSKKIIATTDKSLKIPTENPALHHIGINEKLLPQPSQSFIEKFVEEYNKGNIITDVLVEYEAMNTTIVNRTYNDFEPKINTKDNTITIRKVKDSWSREELLHIVECAWNGGAFWGSSKPNSHYFNKWIEENL
jgi:hypothetical protein